MHRSKFDSKMKEGIFVGYSVKRKAFRVYDIEENTIVESRDVKFEEDKRGVELLKNQETDENTYLKIYINSEDNPHLVRSDGKNNTIETHETEKNVLNRSIRSTRKNINYCELSDNEEDFDEVGKNNFVKVETVLPKTYKEAINSKEADKWMDAMKTELKSLDNHKVWRLVEKPDKTKIISSRWVYAIKENPDGSLKYKARLVAVGYSQSYGTDYKETYSPVIRPCSLRAILAYAAIMDCDIRQLDVQTAYLYGELKEQVYINQPPGFQNKNRPKAVCKLNKALYGLKQSGKVWNETLTDYLLSQNFVQLKSDRCVFIFNVRESKVIIGLYTDDLLVISSDRSASDHVIAIIQKRFSVREIEKTNNYLGMEIEKNKREVKISQHKYIEEILKKYKMQDCNAIKTPLDPNQDLDEYENSPKTNPTEYQGILGSVMYLATRTRPDIAFAVSLLSRYANDPRKIHLTAIKRLLAYLKGTKTLALRFSGGENGVDTEKLHCYVDASWKDGKSVDRRSTSGYLFMIGSNLLTWSVKIQHTVALSTCDAELTALTEAAKHAVYMKLLLQELYGNHTFNSVLISCDNQAAVQLVKNGVTSAKSNHLIRQVAFLHQQHRIGEIEVNHVSAVHQLADFLTKPLSRVKIEDILLKFKYLKL